MYTVEWIFNQIQPRAPNWGLVQGALQEIRFPLLSDRFSNLVWRFSTIAQPNYEHAAFHPYSYTQVDEVRGSRFQTRCRIDFASLAEDKKGKQVEMKLWKASTTGSLVAWCRATFDSGQQKLCRGPCGHSQPDD